MFCLNLKKMAEKHNFSLYHITMIHVSLMKLFTLAFRTSSLKSEVINDDLKEFLK